MLEPSYVVHVVVGLAIIIVFRLHLGGERKQFEIEAKNYRFQTLKRKSWVNTNSEH